MPFILAARLARSLSPLQVELELAPGFWLRMLSAIGWLERERVDGVLVVPRVETAEEL
jgi:hypothetical protein